MSGPLALWDRLVATGVLGTEGRPFEIPEAGPGLEDVLDPMRGREPEAGLLGAAAVLSAFRAAGREPATTDRPPAEPAPADHLPEAGPACRSHLTAILAGPFGELLDEWCRAAVDAGRRIPGDWAPALLDRASKRIMNAETLAAVLGARGRWLAARHPTWCELVTWEAEPAELWETGTKVERGLLLARLRRSNPAAARALVESTWEQEEHADRAAFVGAFFEGLSDEDEPFLESALSDRRKPVRTAAADLLARLPDSALVARMVERADPLLELGGRLRPRLRIDLPEAPDKAAVRDGIQKKPPARVQMGERAWWLFQTLAGVPPRHWSERFGKTPKELLAASARNDWSDALLRGFARATIRTADTAWAEAYIETDRVPPADLGISWGALFDVLPLDRRQAFLARGLRASKAPPHVLARVFEVETAWGRDLSEAVLDFLEREMRGPPKEGTHGTLWMLEATGSRLHLGVRARSLRAGDPWYLPTARGGGAIRELETVFRFRRDFVKELNA
jgi:hypothetical protein